MYAYRVQDKFIVFLLVLEMFINVRQVFASNSKECDPREQSKECPDEVIVGEKGLSRSPEEYRTEVKDHRPKHTVTHSPSTPHWRNVGTCVEVEACAYVCIEP